MIEITRGRPLVPEDYNRVRGTSKEAAARDTGPGHLGTNALAALRKQLEKAPVARPINRPILDRAGGKR